MRGLVRSVQAQYHEQALSTAGLLVWANEPPEPCPVCGGPLRVQKTLRRTRVTLEHGPFEVRETVRVCGAGCRERSGARVLRRPRPWPV